MTWVSEYLPNTLGIMALIVSGDIHIPMAPSKVYKKCAQVLIILPFKNKIGSAVLSAAAVVLEVDDCVQIQTILFVAGSVCLQNARRWQ